MSNALLTPQALRAALAISAIGAGSFGLGSLARAATAKRDNSLAFGDTNLGLQRIVNNDDYLSSVNRNINLPRKQRPGKRIEVDDLLSASLKQADFWEDLNANFEALKNPLTFALTGSSNPTGNESVFRSPAFWGGASVASLAGLASGRNLTDKRIKRIAGDNVRRKRDNARREFEAALIYEQDAAARRNKRASEGTALEKALDNIYSAFDRVELVEKTLQKKASGNANIVGPLIGATTVGASLIAYHNFMRAFENARRKVEQNEKERMLGVDQSFEDLYRDISARHIEGAIPRVSKFPAPTVGTELVRGLDRPSGGGLTSLSKAATVKVTNIKERLANAGH